MLKELLLTLITPAFVTPNMSNTNSLNSVCSFWRHPSGVEKKKLGHSWGDLMDHTKDFSMGDYSLSPMCDEMLNLTF